MQQHNINAAIQLLPIVTKEHPYEWVDKVIELIMQSGLAYEVGPFSTSIEGSYKDVTSLVDTINEFLLGNECPEWILSVQYQLRSGSEVTAEEKTGKFREITN